MELSQNAQLQISHILQGLALAGILWVGSSINELKTTVSVNDYRINQIEQKIKAE